MDRRRCDRRRCRWLASRPANQVVDTNDVEFTGTDDRVTADRATGPPSEDDA
jgi:hypothetical protein